MNNTTEEKNNRLSRRPSSELSQQLFEIGKIPPQSTDLEEAVIGALMIEPEALTITIEILQPTSFYKESHARIFSAVQNLFERSEPVDILTVTNELKRIGQLELVGGAYYISQLTNRVASAANIEFHARIISQKFIQRELIRISTELIRDAYEDTADVFDLLEEAETRLFMIAHSNIKRSYAKMSTLVGDVIRAAEAAGKKHDGITGVASGFPSIDRCTGGWQNSDLIILAARPSMGKTAMAINIARNAAIDFNKPVAVFSLEMSSLQLVQRLVSGEADMPTSKLRKGNIEEYEFVDMHKKIARLTEAPIFIDDTPGLSVFELRAKARRLKAQHGISLLVIDYLQLMTVGRGEKHQNREQEVSTISRSLKSIAKELDIPIIALSQLSRKLEERKDKRPQLSDLRDSGAVEQDADMVVFIHRPEYYGITVDEAGESTAGVAEIIIAKHRNGSVGSIPMRWVDRTTKFIDKQDSETAAEKRQRLEKEMQAAMKVYEKLKTEYESIGQDPPAANSNQLFLPTVNDQPNPF